MFKSVLKLLFFVLFFLSILGVLFLISNVEFKKQIYYAIDSNKSVLVVGSSHTEYAINEEVNNKVFNISQSGDCSFYNFFKTKSLVGNNPQIRTVVLLYTNNMFLYGIDEWIYDEKHMGYKYPKYSNLLDFDSHLFLAKKNSKSLLIAMRDALRTNLLLLLKRSKTPFYISKDWGGFKTTSKVADLRKKDADFEMFYSDTTLSRYDIFYVEKIKDYCDKEKINLVLVRTPTHKSFPKVNEAELLSFKQKYLTNTPFLDYSDSLFLDYEFKDVQHLNDKGSERFTKMLMKDLNY